MTLALRSSMRASRCASSAPARSRRRASAAPARAPAARARAAAPRAGSAYPAGASRPRSRPAPLAGRALAGSQAASAKKPRKPVLHGNPARALRAFEAMQRYYYIQGSGPLQGEPFSYLWPFSQALAATVSMANVPGAAGLASRGNCARG